MREIFKTVITLFLVSMLLACSSNVDNTIEEPEESTNDEIVLFSEGSYTYVYFGTYPQKEIVSKDSDCGTYGKDWYSEDDYIVDEDLYSTLESLSEDNWDNNGDTTLDDCKYRRIKKDDATYSTVDDINYYDWPSSSEYHYFKFEPIKWRVLKQDDNNLFLLSELALDGQMYNTEIKNITWQTSTIRSWLNGYDASENLYGTDYTNNNFIDIAFSDTEQDIIQSTLLQNNDNSKNGTEGGEDTNDKIFLLSEEETYGDDVLDYGFESDYKAHDIARQSKSSTYAKAMGVYTECEANELGNCFWWLRTPGSYTGLFILMRCDGSIYRGGQHANSKSRGVRPAMYITLSDD